MNKKKQLIILFLILIVSIMLYSIISNILHEKAKEDNLETLPDFAFYDLNNYNDFTKSSLLLDKHVIIIYFNTQCNSCINELDLISNNLKLLSEYQILFVSNEDTSVLKKFKIEHSFFMYKNIFFLQDRYYTFNDLFGYSSYPTTLVYNKNLKLVKLIKGEISGIKSLI